MANKKAKPGRSTKAECKSKSASRDQAQPKVNGHAVSLPPMGPALTPMQELFIAAYCNCLNATKAAIAAGHPETSARQIGSENLSKPYIWAEIRKRLNAMMEPYDVTARGLIRQLVPLAYCDLGRFYRVDDLTGLLSADFRGITPDELACIEEIQTEEYAEGRAEDAPRIIRTRVKRADRLQAIQLLGRYKEITAWKDVSEVKDVTERTTEEKRALLASTLKAAAARKSKAVN